MEDVQKFVAPLIENVERVIVGKRSAIEFIMVALLCEGHVLLEDVPGSGKTMLARVDRSQPGDRLQAHPVHARPAAERYHRAYRYSIRKAGNSSSSPVRFSSTSCWRMRSTAPRRARRRLCWRRCRNSR